MPTNVRGEPLSPEDDVSYQRYVNSDKVSSGYISFKKYAEKSTARTGDNSFVRARSLLPHVAYYYCLHLFSQKIFFVIKGSLQVTINNHSFKASSKSWFSVPPSEYFYSMNESLSFVVCFSVDTVYSIMNENSTTSDVIYFLQKEVMTT